MNSSWSYSPETPNLGQIRRFLEPCDLEIWRMTLKNNRAPLLSNIKLYASFHHHMWIQSGVTVRKRLSWVVSSVTLTFDLWPWPFAWTLLWSLVITPENFMMIRWCEHSQKGVTDRQTDGQTENTIKANLRDLIAATGLVILLKFDPNHRFFVPCDLEIWWMALENNRAPLLYYIKLCASFQIHRWIQIGITVRKR